MASEYIWTKPTNKNHKIILKSEFIYAVWHWGKARGGSQINIEVRTSFVGDGATLELTFKGEKAKKFGSLKEKIFSNRYRGTVELPPNFEIGEDIWFEVKLPKHGVKGVSNRIPAYPMPILNSLSWNQQVAHRGDVLKLTGEFSKIEPNADCIVTIYEYDRDGVHDKIIDIPTSLNGKSLELLWEFEYHEDTDEIPTQEEMEKVGGNYNPPEYFFVVDFDGCKLGSKQESGILGFEDWISMDIIDDDGVLLIQQKIKIVYPDGTEMEHVTDKHGRIVLDKVLPGLLSVSLVEDNEETSEQS